MNKKLKILLLFFLLIIVGIFIYEEFFLTKRYEFKIEHYKINITADECETCFLDWPIDNYFKVTDLKNNRSIKFDMYTEGPRLEFGTNTQKTELIINCPGFDTKFLILNNLTVIEGLDFSQIEPKLLDFKILYNINNQKELIELEEPILPSRNYEE